MELSLDLVLVVIALVCAIVSLVDTNRRWWLPVAVILLAIAALPLG